MKITYTYFLCLVFLMNSVNSIAQEKWRLRIMASPTIGKVITERKTTIDQISTTDQSVGMGGAFYGGGLGIGYKLLPNWLIGCNLSLAKKAEKLQYQNNYVSGNPAGSGFTMHELVFFESTLYLERNIPLKNPAWRFIFAPGLFLGRQAYLLREPDEALQKDLGFSFSAGIERKWFFTSLEFKKGIFKTNKWHSPHPSTTTLSLNFGLSLPM